MDTVDGSCTSIAVITTVPQLYFSCSIRLCWRMGYQVAFGLIEGGKCTGGNLHVISPPQRTRKGKFYCWP